MIVDQALDRKIGKVLLKEYEKARSEHESSGKLSASMLGQPIQWQVLKLLGILPEPLDEYVVRKFRRGDHVEAWAIKQMGDSVINSQEPVTYITPDGHVIVGIIDANVDSDQWEHRVGVIPHEIKSVSNAKYKRIVTGVYGKPAPDRGHTLQGCVYALAKGSDHFAIDYIATDDYRVQTYVLKTADYTDEVNQIAREVYEHLAAGTIPAFVAVETWQKNKEYAKYLDWVNLSDAECLRKFELLQSGEVLYEQIKLGATGKLIKEEA